MVLYKTIKEEGYFEHVIEKSRFICYTRPVESREEAETFFNEIRKKHRDATHNVPAMVIGEHMEIQWGSDDGEPQGTSGAPIVQMLVNEGITDVALVVTRYFGGIKLGTGGLVRAYTQTAKFGIEESNPCDVEERVINSVSVDYSSLAKIQKQESKETFIIENITYLDNVIIDISTSKEGEQEQLDYLINLTNGKAEFSDRRVILMKV